MLFNVQTDWAKVRVTAKPIEEIANNILYIYRNCQKKKTTDKSINLEL